MYLIPILYNRKPEKATCFTHIYKNPPHQRNHCFPMIRGITEEILRLRELQAQTAMDDNAKTEHKKRIRELLKFIERQKSKVLVFDGSLVKKLLEKVTVYDDYLEFRFKSGVTVSIEK